MPEVQRGVVRAAPQVLVEVTGQPQQGVPDERLPAGEPQLGGGTQREGDPGGVDGPGQQIQRPEPAMARASEPTPPMKWESRLRSSRKPSAKTPGTGVIPS